MGSKDCKHSFIQVVAADEELVRQHAGCVACVLDELAERESEVAVLKQELRDCDTAIRVVAVGWRG